MKPEEIPEFINSVMTQIEAGIELFSGSKIGSLPEGTMMSVAYPEQVEIQLCIETHTTYDDGTADGEIEIEHQQCWVKIPWPKRVG